MIGISLVWIFLNCVPEGYLGSGTSENPDACIDSTAYFVSGICFWKISELNNFTNSQKRCLEQGGTLAVFPNKIVEDAVTEVFRSGMPWIGVHDMYTEGMYINILNNTVNYTNWAEGEPNFPGKEDCVRLSQDGWRDFPCSITTTAVCSRYLKEKINKNDQFSSPANESTTSQPANSHLATTKTISIALTLPANQSTTIKTNTYTATQQSTTIQSAANQPLTTQSTATPSIKTIFLAKFLTRAADLTTVSQKSQATAVQSRSKATASTLSLTTYSVATQSTEILTSGCVCPYKRTHNFVSTESEAQLKTKIEAMKKELTVNKAMLSSSVRKRTSASDPRPSAALMGKILGILLIITITSFIVLSDASGLYRNIRLCFARESIKKM